MPVTRCAAAGGAAHGALGGWSARGESLSCHEQRAQGPGSQPPLRDMAGANDPDIFVHLDCEGIKAQGFLSSGSLLGGTLLDLCCCYLISPPRLNYF